MSFSVKKMSPEAQERMIEMRRQVGGDDSGLIEALLLRGIEDTSPLTLRKLFPDSFGTSAPSPTKDDSTISFEEAKRRTAVAEMKLEEAKVRRLHKVTIRAGGEYFTAYAQTDEAKRMIANFEKSTTLWTKRKELENELRTINAALEPNLVEKTVLMIEGEPEAV